MNYMHQYLYSSQQYIPEQPLTFPHFQFIKIFIQILVLQKWLYQIIIRKTYHNDNNYFLKKKLKYMFPDSSCKNNQIKALWEISNYPVLSPPPPPSPRPSKFVWKKSKCVEKEKCLGRSGPNPTGPDEVTQLGWCQSGPPFGPKPNRPRLGDPTWGPKILI